MLQKEEQRLRRNEDKVTNACILHDDRGFSLWVKL